MGRPPSPSALSNPSPASKSLGCADFCSKMQELEFRASVPVSHQRRSAVLLPCNMTKQGLTGCPRDCHTAAFCTENLGKLYRSATQAGASPQRVMGETQLIAQKLALLCAAITQMQHKPLSCLDN